MNIQNSPKLYFVLLGQMYIYMLILFILKQNCFDFTKHKTEEIYQLRYVFTELDTFQKTSFEYQIKLLDPLLYGIIGIKLQLNQDDYLSDRIFSFEAFKSQQGFVDFRITSDTFKVLFLTN